MSQELLWMDKPPPGTIFLVGDIPVIMWCMLCNSQCDPPKEDNDVLVVF